MRPWLAAAWAAGILLVAGLPSGGQALPDSVEVLLPVKSSRVRVLPAVPSGDRGAPPPVFRDETRAARKGRVAVRLGREPVYLLDGDTSPGGPVPAEGSPFGIHPALVPGPDPFGPAREIGVRWHRGIYAWWIQVQPTEEDLRTGTFHWEANDREWGRVPRGMAVMANFGLPERREGWPRRGPGPPGPPPRDVGWKLNQPEERYLRFVRAAVERYDGDGVDDMPGLRVPIRCWQVENEPDLAGPGDPDGYARLQEITYRAVKEACPEATVLMGGQSGGGVGTFRRFFQPVLERLGGRFVDVFDYHHFGDARLDWRRVEAPLQEIRSSLNRLGYSSAEIWITETGTYSGTPGDEGRPGPRVRRDSTQSEREQARDLVKRFVFPLSLGVRRVFWAFGLVEGFQHDDGFFDHTGLVYDGEYDLDPPRGTRKLAYHAYARMTSELDGADWSKARRIDAGPHVMALRVPRGAGAVIVAWYDPP